MVAVSKAPDLTAASLCALLKAEGLPCVRVVTADAAGSASTADEGLRIIDGSDPVRVFYAIPAGNDGAASRRGQHLMWLAEWAERRRWSTKWTVAEWLTVHPEPWPATYMRDGHEVFRVTGRRVDADLGSWVTLWIVYDSGAWADWIEADVAADIEAAGKLRASREYMGRQRLDDAARIRADGPRTTVRDVHYGDNAQARAEQSVWRLAAAHPNPGVRYEAAPITATGTCVTCYCPMIYADDQWWHHTGNYPAACCGPRPPRDLPLEPGEWEINGHTMTCGYCGDCVTWPETQRSWVQLTGIHSLGVHKETGELVVLAEVEGIAAHPGQTAVLAHHCKQIPGAVYTRYAARIAAVTGRSRSTETIGATA